MNKSQLIDLIAEEGELTKAAAKRTYEAFFAAMTETLQNGSEVDLSGFGKFKTTLRAARKGRDLHTGKEITIPERMVVSFKAAKALREAVQQEAAEA